MFGDGDRGEAKDRLAALHDRAQDTGTDEPLPAVHRGAPSTPADILARLAARAASSGGVGAMRSRSRPRGRVGRLVERWVPAGLRDARVDPGRPGALVLSAVALVAAVVAAIGVWVDRPVAEPAPPLLAVAPGRAPSVEQRPTQLVVSVVGRVASPGLVTLPEGARVADAVAAAGGALPDTDLSTLNLARKLADGDQLAVGVPPAADAAADTVGTTGSSRSGAHGRASGKINLNTATAAELHGLPGVGPVTAQRILEWRAHHGRFTSVEQLREVGGIGEARLARMKDLVTL